MNYLMVRGTVRPALVLSLLEIPLLIAYFFSYDYVVWADYGPVRFSSIVMGLLALCAFIVGFATKDAGRAIKIFTLAQVVAFTVSTVPFFIYPPVLVEQAVMAVRGGGTMTQAISGIEEFIAGWAIAVVLVGIALSPLGSFVGEWMNGQRGELLELVSELAPLKLTDEDLLVKYRNLESKLRLGEEWNDGDRMLLSRVTSELTRRGLKTGSSTKA